MLRQGKQSVADCGGWMSTNRSEASNRSWLVGGKTEGGGVKPEADRLSMGRKPHG